MVKRHSNKMDQVFRALADPTRRMILQRVVESDRSVAELSSPFSISPPAVSRHLKVLEDAGMLERIKKGKHHHFRLKTEPLLDVRQLLANLTAFWIHRLDSLDEFLDDELAAQKKQER